MNVYQIDITVQDPRWSSALPNLETLTQRAIDACVDMLIAEARTHQVFDELSLAFLNDESIRALNKQYRERDKPTNVLSFPGTVIDGRSPLLGDVVLGYETVTKEASGRGLDLADHVTHLMVHGFYHLHGFDHQNDEEARVMEGLEVRTLEVLGISNPYVKDEML